MLDFASLYFELERFKRERTWHNFNVTEAGLRTILLSSDWYELYIPEGMIAPITFDGVRTLQAVAAELLKRYVEKLYGYEKRQFIEPRLEVRELTREDENIPNVEEYVFNIDADDATLANHIQSLRADLVIKKEELVNFGDIDGLNFATHLFSPIFHLRKQGEVTVQPISLNDSEFRFVQDLCEYVKSHKAEFQSKGQELFLLRNLSRGKGVGFAEASNFHPDFILWLVEGSKQYLTFVEPHGLQHESLESDKITFAKRIKDIEKRLGDPNLVLNSFILSPTPYQNILWMPKPIATQLLESHILFLDDTGPVYLSQLFNSIKAR